MSGSQAKARVGLHTAPAMALEDITDTSSLGLSHTLPLPNPYLEGKGSEGDTGLYLESPTIESFFCFE